MKLFNFVGAGVAIFFTATASYAGSVFLTGHDPDFHATRGGNTTGAQNINNVAIDYILDSAFNPLYGSGINKFLYVEGKFSVPSSHTPGVDGIVASGYSLGTDFEHHDASTLSAELDLLGTKYSGIVVASDFGARLSSAELDILNARSADIINFLNVLDGGLFAMSQSGGGQNYTSGSTLFGFLPFVVSSTPANQSETGVTVTAFGQSLGLQNSDVNGNFSHNVFDGDFGLNVVNYDSQGRILSLAGRGMVDPDDGLNPVPLPAGLPLILAGFGALALLRRRAT